jgi:phospholipid/cholesterol/gamma-HCH transport system substrate-binding protein
VRNVSGRVDSTLAAVEALVKAVDAKKIDTISPTPRPISKNVADASGDLKAPIQKFQETATTYNDFGKKAQATLDKVDTLVAQIDPAKVKGSVDDISQATKDARVAVASIKDVANTVNAHQKDIDQTIQNVTQMANKLNAASTRVDGILAKLDTLLGDRQHAVAVHQARDTLESFKKVADNLNARIGPIADNLQKFSSGGLRDVQALVNDARSTFQNLNDAISNFDKDPAAPDLRRGHVKQYDGRTRR